MGAVKQALIEVEDLVCGCLQQHRTLNQTIRDLKEIYDKEGKFNTYLLNEDPSHYYFFRNWGSRNCFREIDKISYFKPQIYSQCCIFKTFRRCWRQVN